MLGPASTSNASQRLAGADRFASRNKLQARSRPPWPSPTWSSSYDPELAEAHMLIAQLNLLEAIPRDYRNPATAADRPLLRRTIDRAEQGRILLRAVLPKTTRQKIADLERGHRSESKNTDLHPRTGRGTPAKCDVDGAVPRTFQSVARNRPHEPADRDSHRKTARRYGTPPMKAELLGQKRSRQSRKDSIRLGSRSSTACSKRRRGHSRI